MGDDRDGAIEFGDLEGDLEGEEYSIGAADLLERYGECVGGRGDNTDREPNARVGDFEQQSF